MSYPRFQRARDFKFFNRSAGNLTLNNTAWADLPTIGTTWDITLPAQVSDVIEAGLSGGWGAEAVQGNLEVVTIVSAAVVGYFGGDGTTASGVIGWAGGASVFANIGGTIMKALVSGDLSAGTVTLRLRYRTSTAGNKTLYANTGNVLQFSAKNLGPMDPN